MCVLVCAVSNCVAFISIGFLLFWPHRGSLGRFLCALDFSTELGWNGELVSPVMCRVAAHMVRHPLFDPVHDPLYDPVYDPVHDPVGTYMIRMSCQLSMHHQFFCHSKWYGLYRLRQFILFRSHFFLMLTTFFCIW